MSPKYDLLLADADNTLFDFYKAEKAALHATLLHYALPADDAIITRYSQINEGLWKAFERGETTQDALRIDRFRLLLNSLGASHIPPEEAGLYFTDHLGLGAYLMPGALEFVAEISLHMPIVMVTNGIATVQRSRLARSEIAPYIRHAVISGEIGSSKPDPRMLFIAMEKMGIQEKSRVILLGDSLSADIEAANRAGISSIHLCGPGNKKEASPATFQAETLIEARDILLS